MGAGNWEFGDKLGKPLEEPTSNGFHSVTTINVLKKKRTLYRDLKLSLVREIPSRKRIQAVPEIT